MRFSANIAMLSAVLLAGGCTLPDTDSYRLPTASNIFRPLSVTNYRDKVLPPVTATDLVDANGNCAGAPAATVSGDAAGPGGAPNETALLSGPIALEMTECDLVRRAGAGARVEIGANDRRERTATITYIGGERPGIYSFTDGRLKSMERGAEPAAEKTAKKKPAKPPAKRAAKPNQVSVQ